jgi:hypothetical protein
VLAEMARGKLRAKLPALRLARQGRIKNIIDSCFANGRITQGIPLPDLAKSTAQ